MSGRLTPCFYRIAVPIMLFAMSGCRAAEVSTPGASTPTPTAHVSPGPSRSPTNEPVSASTPVVATTWTPLPTLAPIAAVNQTTKLFRDNAGCELPCWWGIVPGETSWETARQFLAGFASHLGSGVSHTYLQDGVSYFVQNFDVQYPVAGHIDTGRTDYSVANGVVNRIWILPRGTELRYPAHQFLATQGRPERAWIAVDPDWKLFSLLLYYPSRGITALYEGPAKRGDSSYELCLQEGGPELWLWSPGKALSINKDRFIGPTFGLGPNGHEQYMRRLETVWPDLDAVYRIFESADQACIETPRSLWEAP